MFYDGPVLNLCNFLGRAVFLFSNVKPKRQELILKRTFKSKKFLCLCFWVCGWTRNGWCSLSPWIVCHSHYFLFFFLPFCLCQFSESMNKIACIFTDKREKPVFPFIISFAETKKKMKNLLVLPVFGNANINILKIHCVLKHEHSKPSSMHTER